VLSDNGRASSADDTVVQDFPADETGKRAARSPLPFGGDECDDDDVEVYSAAEDVFVEDFLVVELVSLSSESWSDAAEVGDVVVVPLAAVDVGAVELAETEAWCFPGHVRRCW